MSSAGTVVSMMKSLKSNARLLDRNDMFSQLKNINSRENDDYTHISMTKEALSLLRHREKRELKKNVFINMVVGVLVIIPVSGIVATGFYLLILALL